MPETRRTPGWLPVAAVAVVLAVAALTGLFQNPRPLLRLAADLVPPVASFADLPGAAMWSLLRLTGAYLASLVFSWIVAYRAATRPAAARFILPLLDVGQSVPVLGFFPAAIYVFVGVLGGGRAALELAAMFLIFTSMTWNIAFGIYEGLSTIPAETRSAVQSLGVRGVLLWRSLLLPACVPSIIYNSMLSWTNGWYFLIASEIIAAGPVQYDLPGLGSVLSVAFARGDLRLATAALITLIAVVLAIEFVVWRPVRAWSSRFRYDTQPDRSGEETFRLPDFGLPTLLRPLRSAGRALGRRLSLAAANRSWAATARAWATVWRLARWPVWVGLGLWGALAVLGMVRALLPPWPPEAASLPLALLLSFLRINAAYVLALLWIIPVGLWASDHPRGARALSTVAQVGASIPATAFFPVLVALLVGRFGGMGMEMISVALALTGMQWYLLFNMLAGVQRVPNDLRESLRSLGLDRREIHRKLVLPACMPSLVTGSVVAWGGTWNALILSEFVTYHGRVYQVTGVGALLNQATFQTGNRTLLFLSLALLIVTVVTFNRVVWARLYRYVNHRFVLEG
ncbi:MAG: ABC transporter permease subunit [Candidatus Eisenbacteria bacterium]